MSKQSESHSPGASHKRQLVYWTGSVDARDDFGVLIDKEFIDGRTVQGPWAIMTPETHDREGVGLGQGRGQRYKKQPDGKWLKVEG